MKWTQKLLVLGLVAVFVGLVIPSCDMPWDDDDDDDDKTAEPISPLAPILGEHSYSGFEGNAIFDYEHTFDYTGDPNHIGDTGSGDWAIWLETLPGALKDLILLANETIDGTTDNRGYYKVYLEITETHWELHVDQTDLAPTFHYLWGIVGTHQLEPVGSNEYRGRATTTNRYSRTEDKWVNDEGIMDFRIWIEEATWLRFEMKDTDKPSFQCPFTRDGGLFLEQSNPIRFPQ